MGGGGGTPTPTEPTQPAVPTIPMMGFQPFQPGQQGLLAQQMAQGFGGGILEQQQAMDYYRPMSVPVITRPDEITAYLRNIGIEPVNTDDKK